MAYYGFVVVLIWCESNVSQFIVTLSICKWFFEICLLIELVATLLLCLVFISYFEKEKWYGVAKLVNR